MRRLGVIANSTAGQSTVSRTSGLAGELAGNFVSVANAVARSGAETARAAHFWSTVLAIWGRYKVTQTRAHIAALRGNAKEAQRLWKRRHNVEAETMWRLCVGMRVCCRGITSSPMSFAQQYSLAEILLTKAD
eukprot:IDg13788t1